MVNSALAVFQFAGYCDLDPVLTVPVSGVPGTRNTRCWSEELLSHQRIRAFLTQLASIGVFRISIVTPLASDSATFRTTFLTTAQMLSDLRVEICGPWPGQVPTP